MRRRYLLGAVAGIGWVLVLWAPVIVAQIVFTAAAITYVGWNLWLWKQEGR